MGRCLQGEIPCLKPFKEDSNIREWGQRGLRGLVNMGNTCFMSCILQVLAHNPASQAHFLNCDHKRTSTTHPSKIANATPGNDNRLAQLQKSCLASEVADLFAALFKHSQSHKVPNPVVPHRVLYATWKFADRMAGYEQQDAHEFLMVLLDGLLAHSEQDKVPAPIHEMFRGSFRSDIVSTAVSSCI